MAAPYIGWRALTFVPAIVSTVGFAAFRGTLDVTTPMKITLLSQTVNLVLDPLLIFGGGFIKAMGVAGAAMATSASEVMSATLYLSTMLKRGIVTLNSLMRVPSWGNIGKLMVGGAAVQMRSIAQNITFLAVMRAILTMDATGTAAAAHTVSAQMFQLCLIAVLALSTLASILIPQKLNAALDGGGGAEAAKTCADRLLVWGLLLGTFLACVQLAALPALKFFTPLENVQAMARGPVMIGALQVRSRQKFFTHRPVSTFDHVLFQLTDEHSERPRRCRSTVSCSSRRV
jgi:Na+-driven multidrug efflux pump|tara:strand:- start:3027 stop:3890 length:864 start_codon:yes stop_codon:yes gene_type:complete